MGPWLTQEHVGKKVVSFTDLLMVLLKVNVGDTVAMLPKSRRALTIQEIAALARSSLHGTYPTSVPLSTLSFLPSFPHVLWD